MSSFLKTLRVFLLEDIFRNISFRYFVITFADAFVCDTKLGTITCADKVVDMFLKCLSSFVPCVFVQTKHFVMFD